MKKSKKKNVKAKTKKKEVYEEAEKLDPTIEKIYEKTITFMCPIRGLVTQKVKVKRYKSKQVQAKEIVKGSTEDILSKVDELDTTLMDSE